MALVLGFIAGGAWSVCSAGVLLVRGMLAQGVFGISSDHDQRLLCILGMRLRMASWLWLGSGFGVVAFVCFLVFPLPPLPIRGSRGFSSIVSPLNSLFSVTGAWFGVWGGRQGSWLGCGQGRLMGCSTDLGLGCWCQPPDPWAPNLHLRHRR